MADKFSLQSDKAKTLQKSKPQNEDFVSKYKTEICHNWEMNQCQWGEQCNFAHGIEELRVKKISNKYKTVKCQKFYEKGYCPYGQRCQFLHATIPVTPTKTYQQKIQVSPLGSQNKKSTLAFQQSSTFSTEPCSPSGQSINHSVSPTQTESIWASRKTSLDVCNTYPTFYAEWLKDPNIKLSKEKPRLQIFKQLQIFGEKEVKSLNFLNQQQEF